MNGASSETRNCMSTHFVFTLSLGASQMQNLRQVPHKMTCNTSLVLLSHSGSAFHSRPQRRVQQLNDALQAERSWTGELLCKATHHPLLSTTQSFQTCPKCKGATQLCPSSVQSGAVGPNLQCCSTGTILQRHREFGRVQSLHL